MRKTTDRIFGGLMAFFALITVLMLAFLIYFIFRESQSAIREVGLFNLLLGDQWRPIIFTGEPSFGIRNMVLSTLYIAVLAVGFALIIGVGCALYLACAATDKQRMIIMPYIDLLASIPSVVYGFMGLYIMIKFFENCGMAAGESILAGGVTQGIMILPLIQVRSEKALREIDTAQVQASYALGVSRAHTIWRIVLPQSLPQLVSGVILGGCHAMGAAAPLIFTGAVIMSKVPKSVMKPAMAPPYHLYMLLTQGTSSENAYGTAFVMMMVVLVTNSLATWFAWRNKE